MIRSEPEDLEGDEDAILEIAKLLMDGASKGEILSKKGRWPEFRIRWMSEAEILVKNDLTWPDWHPMGKLRKTNQDFSFHEYGEAVSALAIPELKKSLGSSFRGMCTDTLKGSYDSGATVERAVEVLVMDTEYWEMA